MPFMAYPDERIAMAKTATIAPPIASVVALDQQIPQMSRPMQFDLGKIPYLKVGVAKNITESELKLVRDYDAITRSLQTTFGGNPMLLEDMFIVKPAELVQSSINLGTVLAQQVAYGGKCTHIDKRTKIDTSVQVELDYTTTLPANSASSPNYRTALTGNARWNVPANATPIANIVNHLQSYYAVYYSYPPMQMSETVLQFALDTLEVRGKVAGLRGAITSTAAPDPAALAAMARPSLDEFRRAVISELGQEAGNPMLASWDIKIDRGQYYEENLSLPGVATAATLKPYSPADSYAFLPTGNIERAFFPSLASTYVGANSGADVKFAETFQNVFTVIGKVEGVDPPQEGLTCSALFFPLVRDARMLGGRKVL
jgi:hypothetical protein